MEQPKQPEPQDEVAPKTGTPQPPPTTAKATDKAVYVILGFSTIGFHHGGS